MVSVCPPSDALLQHLPSYLGFSYLGHGVSLHGCSSKAQPLLLTLDEGYLLTTALPDLLRGIAPLGPPAPAQPRFLGHGVAPLSHRPWPWAWGHGIAPPGHSPWPWAWGHGVAPPGRRPWPRTRVTPLVTAPDLGRGVAPLSHSCAVAAWHSRLLPLTSDVGSLLLAAALRAWGPPGFCPWPRTWGSSSRPHFMCRSQPSALGSSL